MATLKIKATPAAVRFFKEKLTGGGIYIDGRYVKKNGRFYNYQNMWFDKAVYETELSTGIHSLEVKRGVIGGSTIKKIQVKSYGKSTAQIHITAFLRRLVITVW